jgi:hypothetical protein
MPTTTHIKFGDGLDVIDEGAGVIRVDAGGGGGGGGGGIQFETYPQEGAWMYVESTGAGTAPPDPADAGIGLVASGGGPIVLESTGGGGVQIIGEWTGSTPVYAGGGVSLYGGMNGGLNLLSEADVAMSADDTVVISAEGGSTAYGIRISADGTGRLDLQATQDGNDIRVDANNAYGTPKVEGDVQITGSLISLITDPTGGGTGNINVASEGTLSLGATGATGNILLSSSLDVIVSVPATRQFEAKVDGTSRLGASENYGWFDYTDVADAAVDLMAGDTELYLSNSNLYVRLAAGMPLKVLNAAGATIFRINEDGALHGKTGKALTFDL